LSIHSRVPELLQKQVPEQVQVQEQEQVQEQVQVQVQVQVEVGVPEWHNGRAEEFHPVQRVGHVSRQFG
jgi:hypothetical protein